MTLDKKFKIALSVILFLIACIMIFSAAYSENVATAFVFILLAGGAIFGAVQIACNDKFSL